MAQSNKQKAQAAISRTNDIIKALTSLQKSREKIKAVEEALARRTFSRDETCDAVKDIGYDVVRISSLVRKHTSCNIKFKRQVRLQNKFIAEVGRHVADREWMEKHTKHFDWNRAVQDGEPNILSSYPVDDAPRDWKREKNPYTGEVEDFTVEPTDQWLEENG